MNRHRKLILSARAVLQAGVLAGIMAAGCARSAMNEENGLRAEPDVILPAKEVVADQALPLREQMSMAVDDLAATLDIDRSTVQILKGATVRWPSSALGCPEPGMAYLDVLTPGSWFVLGVQSRVFHYHAAQGERPFHCPEARRQPPPSMSRLD